VKWTPFIRLSTVINQKVVSVCSVNVLHRESSHWFL